MHIEKHFKVRTEGEADATDLLSGRAWEEGEQTTLQEKRACLNETSKEEEMREKTLRFCLLPGREEERSKQG